MTELVRATAAVFAIFAWAAFLVLIAGCSLPIASANPYAGGTRGYECWAQAWNASEAAWRWHAGLVDQGVFDACMTGRRGAWGAAPAVTYKAP